MQSVDVERQANIRVISIGSDRNLFDPKSPVSQRAIEYGKIFKELHIIVFSLASLGFEPYMLSNNVWIHATNSQSKSKYFFDALRIGNRVLSKIFFGETVISTQDPFESGFIGYIFKKKFKFPLQMQVHTDFLSSQFFNGNVFNPFRYFLARFLLPKADAIRVVSVQIAKSILEKKIKIKKRPIILPIYVDIKKIQDELISVNLRIKYKDFSHIVLMASRLEKEKSIDMAIRAFKKVVKEFPNAGMVIVGQGREELKLRRLVEKLDLTKNIVFEPWQQNLVSYFKTATVFLSTSNYEGYGMTLIEAGAAGCPIITSNVGISREYLRDGSNAYVCEVGDRKCFENKMISLLSNPPILKQFAEEIYKDMSELSYSKTAYLAKYLEATEAALSS